VDLARRRSQHAQRQTQQRRHRPARRGDKVKPPANEHLDVAVKDVVQHSRQEQAERKDRIAQRVRNDPAHRAGAIVTIFVFECEFPFGHITESIRLARKAKWSVRQSLDL
jgi:hypothetical protein